MTFYSCESSVTSNPQNDYVAKWETTLQEGADKSSNTFTAYGYIDKNNSNKGYGTWEEVQQIALSSDEDTDILPMEQVNGSNLDVTMYVNDTPIAMTLYVDENVKYNKYICYIPVSVNTDNIRFEFTNNGVTYTVKAPKRNDSVHFVVTSATTGYWEPPAIVSVYSPCIDDKDNDAKMGVVSVSGGVEGATRVKVTKGTTVTLTAEAKSDKYRFMGWYSDASFSGEPISTDMQYSFVASDTTNEYMYYAKFARQYKVEVIVLTNNVKNTDGGTVKVTDDKGIESEYFLEGQNVTLTATPNKEYTFSGWYLNNDDQSGSALYKSDAKFEIIGINSDYKYYAHFDIKTFSVTATAIRQDDNNKSEVEFTSPEKGPDATVTVTVNYGESATFKANPSTGYKFDGWYSDENCGAESFVSNNNPYTMNNITDDSNSTLYAKFSIIMCDVKVYGVTDGNITETGGTLKYNSDDPAGKIEQKVAYGTTVTLVAKANDGYKFAGWYTDQTCKTQAGEDIIGNYDYTADSITTAKITKNITLYAKFESLTVKTTIYFESRDWSKYNAYVYSSSDGGTWIEAWPGKQELSKDAVTGYYKYEFETDKFTGKFRVIVNDGNGNQYPASNDPGLEGTLGKTYLFRKGSPSALEEFDPNEKISIKLVDETSAGWIHNDTPIMRLCLSDGTYIDLASTNTQKEWVWENVPIYATSFTIKRINKDNTNEVWNTWDTGDRDSNTTYKVADNSSYWQ